MRNRVFQTGSKYELHIGDRNDNEKVTIGIRLKEGTFKEGTNFVAVVLDPDMAEDVAKNILYRIDA